jgi:hypothetical protein
MEAPRPRAKVDPSLDPHVRGFWRPRVNYGASSGANAASRGHFTALRSAVRDAGWVESRNSGLSDADW